jgi:hypothetical protein
VSDEMSWFHDMEPRTAGAASTRCFADLVRDRGLGEAETIRNAALRKRGRSRRLWSKSPMGNYSINVECVLMALGVSDAEIPRLARAYRSGPGASLEPGAWTNSPS